MEALAAMATPNVEFLGPLEDSELVAAMQRCQATIFPSIDDYGLVPLEVNACGRPVLAFPAGGSLHTVKPGVTGEFLREQSAESVVESVREFDPARYSTAEILEHAMKRSSLHFREAIRGAVERVAAGELPHLELRPAGGHASNTASVSAS
jgi:glycosyltransferase involved in cell wall biosynthesis